MFYCKKEGNMRIKKFRAKTLQEGKQMVYSELGEDAVILSTRVIPPKPPEMVEMIELVAALDTKLSTEQNVTLQKPKDINPNVTNEFSFFVDKIFKEISNIKEVLWKINDKITYSILNNYPDDLKELGKSLLCNGFSIDFVDSFLIEIKELTYVNSVDLINKACKLLAGKLTYEKTFEPKNMPIFIMLVGPTGSGKTITSFKLALLYKLLFNLKVAVVTIDNKKLGGWEQTQILSVVSNIMGFYSETPEDFFKNVEFYKKNDVIIIDTPGISPLDGNSIGEIEELIKKIKPEYVLLVLSVTSAKSHFKKCLEGFSKTNPNYLLLTKFDETSSIGGIFEELIQYSKAYPLLYFTTGTNLASEIEPASPEFVANYIISQS